MTRSVELSENAAVVLKAYVAIAGDVSTRSKIVLLNQAEALLRGGWTADELAPVAQLFALSEVDACRFARWAQRYRMSGYSSSRSRTGSGAARTGRAA